MQVSHHKKGKRPAETAIGFFLNLVCCNVAIWTKVKMCFEIVKDLLWYIFIPQLSVQLPWNLCCASHSILFSLILFFLLRHATSIVVLPSLWSIKIFSLSSSSSFIHFLHLVFLFFYVHSFKTCFQTFPDLSQPPIDLFLFFSSWRKLPFNENGKWAWCDLLFWA